MPRPKLLFVATEDWFFASHFLPMARAAREMGLDVAVIARERNHRRVIEATGARLIALEAERRSLDPRALFKQVAALKRIIAAEKPDVLHCIALKPIALAGLACLALALLSSRAYADDFTCADVRAAVATVAQQAGVSRSKAAEIIEAMARSGGATDEQIRRAKACVK